MLCQVKKNAFHVKHRPRQISRESLEWATGQLELAGFFRLDPLDWGLRRYCWLILNGYVPSWGIRMMFDGVHRRRFGTTACGGDHYLSPFGAADA